MAVFSSQGPTDEPPEFKRDVNGQALGVLFRVILSDQAY